MDDLAVALCHCIIFGGPSYGNIQFFSDIFLGQGTRTRSLYGVAVRRTGSGGTTGLASENQEPFTPILFTYTL